MNKRGLVAGAGLLAVTAIGLGVAVRRWRKPAPAKPTAVVSTVFEGPEITLSGRLQAQKTEQVDAPIAGVLDQWFVEEGQEVYEDQLIGRIRNADLDSAVLHAQSALDRAEIRISQLDAQTVNARLEVSRTTAEQIRARNELDRIETIYQRYKNLMDAGAIARLTFEKTESDYIAAKAEAERREVSEKDAQEKFAALQPDSEKARGAIAEQTAALARAKDAVAEGDLHSPADGVVLARKVHQGDQVEDSAELLSVATGLTKLAVSVSPAAAVLARVHAGQHAFVRTDDGEFPGEVKGVSGTEVIVEFSSEKPVTKLEGAAQVRIVF